MNILIYTSTAFALSETFILKQFKNTQHKLFLVSENFQNPELMPVTVKSLRVSSTPINFKDRVESAIQRKIRGTGTFSLPASQEQLLQQFIVDNKIDAVHINYGTNGIKLTPILQKLKIPFIVHFHGYDASQLLSDVNYVKGLKQAFLFSFKIIAVSTDMKQRLVDVGCPPEKIKIIPYGISPEILYTSERTTADVTTILHAGRLTSKKGVLDLVKVFDEIKQSLKPHHKVELIIIGDGEERAEIDNYIETCRSKEFIKILGSQPHKEVLESMKKADIYMLNSRISPTGDMEGFPNTVIEAMASGCAVVSTYHAGIPDAITNNVNGLLVEEKNNEQLKAAINLLLLDKTLRKRLGSTAVETVRNNFLDFTMLKQYSNIYLEAIKK